MKFNLKSAATKSAFGLSSLLTIAVLLPASPAYAGMGTSRPNPPPPPPPADINLVAQEQSTDSSIGTRGYAGEVINHIGSSPYDYNAAAGLGSTSCVSTANGNFHYRLCNTQSPEHWSQLFGITSAHTNSNIYISTDASIQVKLSAGQGDLVTLAQTGKNVLWEMVYTLERGQGESAPITTNPNVLLTNAATTPVDVANLSIPRSLSATFNQIRRTDAQNTSDSKAKPVRPAFNPTNNPAGRVARSIFRLKRLEGFLKDANGKKVIPEYKVMQWLDDPKNAVVYIEPGRGFTLYCDKMSAAAPK